MDAMDRDVTRTRPVEYPESDGIPVGETEEHFDEIVEAYTTLRDHFADEPLVYIASDHFIYFVEGQPKKVVCPDLYLVKGVPKLLPDGRKRPIYKVWENDGKTPCFVLEVTSQSTRRNDAGRKMAIYRDDLRVDEYFLFDLSRDWVETGVRGFRLKDGAYLPVEQTAEGRMFSEQLGLELVADGRHLRFYAPGAAEPIATRAERAERAEQATARAEQAEDEVRRLKAELERRRAGS
jgi:Uma2 family endonuclease